MSAPGVSSGPLAARRLDVLSRELLDTRRFAFLVREHGVSGATSNPTIFAAAIGGSDRYDDQIASLAGSPRG